MPAIKLAIVFAALLSAAVLAAPAARAQGYRPIDAEAQIKKCWDLSQQDRDSGVTGRMRSGTAKTIGCLEEAIIENVGIMLDPKRLSKEQARKHLEEIREGSQKLYWLIYNGHRGCSPSCGTMWHVMHLAANAKILEEMIRDMAQHWSDYPPPVKR